MKIDIEKLIDSVPIMLKGFLGVFLILGIIIVTTILLNAATKKGEKNKITILICTLVLFAVAGTAVIFGLLS